MAEIGRCGCQVVLGGDTYVCDLPRDHAGNHQEHDGEAVLTWARRTFPCPSRDDLLRALGRRREAR